MVGVSRGRTRSTPLTLPKKPVVRWRARVQGPVRHEPVVDARGHVVITHGRGRITELDSRGKVAWSEHSGDAMTSSGPVLMSDGTRAVLVHDNTLFRIAPDGQVLGQHKTRLSGSALPPLPTYDGGLALAADRRAIRVSHLGETTAEGELDSPVTAILGQDGLVYLVSKDGSVHRFFASGRVQRLGSLEHEVVGAAALANDLVVAVVEGNRIAAFDLKTRVSEVRFRAPRGTELAPWLLVSADAKHTFVAASDHTLLGLDAKGNEDFRASLSGGHGVTVRPQALDVRHVPPGLLDGSGSVAIMTPGWYTLVVDSQGQRREIKDGNCLNPVSIVPYAKGAVLTTCREGELWLLGER